MNIKCLKLEGWMKKRTPVSEMHFEDTVRLGGYKKIEPVFSREGRYKVGDEVWFELADGSAYLCPDSSNFDHDLMMADAGRLSEREMRALEEVERVCLASEQQKQILYRERWFRHSLEMNKRFGKRHLAIKQRYCQRGTGS